MDWRGKWGLARVAGLLVVWIVASAPLPARVVAAGGVEERLRRLEAEVTAAEDVSAIKRLQRTYGYFVDKGMWTDVAGYFTDDAVANYPAGTFVGKASIREHLHRNVGGVQPGEVGLGDRRLYNHMSLQPVIHLDPGGRTAKGRWRALAMFGSFGGNATWAEGIYEMQYEKSGGVWKISGLDYHPGFGAPYATGWVLPATPDGAVRAPRRLAHPADRVRTATCEGFPAACIAPFHYANPATRAGASVWDADTLPRSPDPGSDGLRAARLAQRIGRLADEHSVENLQRVYGYYLDRGQWDQAADLFAEQATLEWDQRGVYAGRDRVRQFLHARSPAGPQPGLLNDRLQLQVVADISADGLQARVRSREFAMTGRVGEQGRWSEGIHENTFVKEAGVWKIAALHYYPTFISDQALGWAKDAQPAPGADADLPPDRPPSETYAIYPVAHVPPFHYRHPVTGAMPTYPTTGGPGSVLAQRAQFDVGRAPVARPVRDIAASLEKSQRALMRVKDQHEIENLESAYGYYLDKNLWTDLAGLFSKDGSIELAQRGVYRGARVAEFLRKVFGRGGEGPVAGRLGNHLQLQPVISVAEDGRTARVRSRMLQQMNFGARAMLGGAVYENEMVKEDGIWKIAVDHAFNTFSAEYSGGWTRAAGRGMPGPNADFAWDAPPTARIEMFPVVYDIPYHYANPVSGRTEVVKPPPIDEQLLRFPLPQPAGPVTLSAPPPGMPASISAALREIGPRIDAARTVPLYAPRFPKEPFEGMRLTRDIPYGPHERNRLDVFTRESGAPGRRMPVVVFVHGGGFSRGAKHTDGSPFYDNVGAWAAGQGLLGITVNYRLSPQHQFPSGVEDLSRVVDWIRTHAGEYGGDASRIYLWGHSAGGAHVADYLVRTRRPGVAGAVLTSGIYTLGDAVSVWKDYYGEDVSLYPARESLPLLSRSAVPLLVTGAELDPPNFLADTEALLAARRAMGRPTRHVLLQGHSHLSEIYAVGTEDRTLTDAVLQFLRENPGARR
ncbi:MAG: hypothetical protein RLZZ200_3048 [Pseudomonadota bacterium]|jgi:triacylglycerol lipase